MYRDPAHEAQYVFRRANQRLLAAVRGRLDGGHSIPFLCECLDPACGSTVQITIEDFQDLQANEDRFAIVTGHPLMEGECVLHSEDGVTIIQKNG